MPLNNTFRSAFLLLLCLLTGFFSTPGTGYGARSDQVVPAVQLDVAANPSILATGQAVDITLAAVGTGVTCGAQQTFIPLRLALLIDRSASMEVANTGQQTNIALAEAAVADFLANLNPAQDLAAVISFGQTGVVDVPLSAPAAALQGLNSSLLPGDNTTTTNIGAGLQAAADLLKPVVSPDVAPVIVLLTDGQDSTNSETRDLAKDIKQAGIRVVSIGLGKSIDEGLLRDIATQPSDYYAAPDAAQLKAIYTSIAGAIHEIVPAKDLKVTFTYNPATFALVESSVVPAAAAGNGTLTWTFPRLEGGRQTMRLALRTLAPGKVDVMEKAELTYTQCGQVQQTVVPAGIFPVEILAATPGSDTSCSAGASGASTGLLQTACGGLPWWPFGLLLGLLACLPFFLAANRYDLRAWARCGEWPALRFWTGLGLCLSLALLAAALALSAATYTCAARSGRIFWRVDPTLESAIYLESQQPALGAHPLTTLTGEKNCIGCHTVSNAGPAIAAVRQSTSGRLAYLEVTGAAKAIPDLQGAYPAFSPDGKKLAFAANNEDIFILDLDSGKVSALPGASQPGVVESMPAWSPDGKRVAFVRAAGQNQNLTITTPSDILTVPSSGGQALLVPGASAQGFNYRPSYSPDGKWLAFVHHDDGTTTYGELKASIYLVPSAGGAPRRLQANDGPGGQLLPNAANTWPVWSLDSQTLYFSSRRCGGQYDLFSTRIGPNGESTPASRISELSDDKAYEFGLQEVRMTPPSTAALLPVLPWAVLALLALLLHLFLRPRKHGAVEPTILMRPLPPTPAEGWLDSAQRFKMEMEMVGRPPRERRVENRAADVVFLLDTSGSMQTRMGLLPWQTRLRAVQQAARRCIRCFLSPRQRAAIVGFANEPAILQGLTNSENDLLAGLKGLRAGGETGMLSGLSAARQILEINPRRNAQRVVVLFTDGMPTDPESKVIEAAQSMLASGIRILAIGTADANYDLMRQFVKQPEDFFFVRDRRGLFAAFLSVSHILLRPLAARGITYTHNYDQQRFELLPESVSPRPDTVQPGVITWQIEELDQQPVYFEYAVAPLVEGSAPIALPGTVAYDWGGLGLPQTLGVEASAPVNVKPLPMPADPPLRQIKPPAQLRAPRPVWQPDHALFIGVGTTGRWILNYLLDNLLNAGSGSLPEGLEFLVVDTNEFQRVQTTQNTNVTFAGVSLSPDDIFILDEDLRAPVMRWGQEEALPAELQGWVRPPELAHLDQQLNLSNGSFGRRPLVRAALLRHLQGNPSVHSVWQAERAAGGKPPSLRDWIAERCERARVEDNGRRRVRVFIAGSLAGGMSGALIDTAVLARQAAAEAAGPGGSVRVEGYLVGGLPFEGLPGSPEAARLRLANSFASLREVSRLQMAPGVSVQLGWEGGNPHEPLFDDWLLFSQTVRADCVNADGMVKEGQTPAEGMLKNTLFPGVADLMTLRLEKTIGVLQANDWFNQMRSTATKRLSEEHAAVVGGAGIYSIRVAAADILRVLHLRWSWEVLKAFLTGDQPGTPDFTAPPPQHSIDFSSGNPNNPDFPGDPTGLVARFLKGGRFGGEAPIPSQALADLLIHQGSSLVGSQVLEDALFSGEKNLFNAQMQRVAAAVQHILIGSSEIGSRAARLTYARRFLSAVEEVLRPLRRDLHESGQQQLALYAEFTMRCSQLQGEALDALSTSITQNEAGRPLGLWERLTQRVTLMQDLPAQLDQIACRRYLWGFHTLDAAGKPQFHPFAREWWQCYLQNTVTASLDALSWEIGSDQKLDLVVRHSAGTFGLRQHGMDAFVWALTSIASSYTADAYAGIDLAALLKTGRQMDDLQLAARAGRVSLPLLEMGQPDPGTPPDLLIGALPETLYNTLDWQHPFAARLLNEAQQVMPVTIQTQLLLTTNRAWLAYLHLRSSTRLDLTQEWSIGRQKYDEQDGWSFEQRAFYGHPTGLAVLPSEGEARALETRLAHVDGRNMAMYDYPRAGILHPYVVAALQQPREARLFALAAAEGRLVQKPSGAVVLRLPGSPETEVILASWTAAHIDPLVQALQQWAQRSAPGGDLAVHVAVLQERYRLDNNDPTPALRPWWKEPLPQYGQGAEDRRSLGWWMYAVARAWLLQIED